MWQTDQGNWEKLGGDPREREHTRDGDVRVCRVGMVRVVRVLCGCGVGVLCVVWVLLWWCVVWVLCWWCVLIAGVLCGCGVGVMEVLCGCCVGVVWGCCVCGWFF